MLRREFFKNLGGGTAAIALGANLRAAWGARSSWNGRALVVVFLRGGCDGLNVLVPYGDHDYYSARPGIAISAPGSNAADAAVDVDGFFGMHPALLPLRETLERGSLAFLPAVHYPDSRHSHFESQSILERAGGAVGNGWLNRYLSVAGNPAGGLAIGAQLPDSMAGDFPVPAYAKPLDLSFSSSEAFDDALERVLSHAYVQDSGQVTSVPERWRSSAVELLADRAREASVPGAMPYPEGEFGVGLAAAASLLRHDSPPSVITLSLGGWDTHSRQGGSTGRQAKALDVLARGLATFQADLGARRDEVAVLVQTEFGRTLIENASGGTDHGDASTWIVISDTLRGGVHLGARGWPGLDELSLADGRALAPTVDYRDVYAEILQAHMGCSTVDAVIPNRPNEPTGLV